MAITDEQVKAFCKAFLEAPEFATFKEKVLDGLEAAYAAQFQSEEYAGLVKELREDLLQFNLKDTVYENVAKNSADAIEALLAERDALKAELIDYKDAAASEADFVNEQAEKIRELKAADAIETVLAERDALNFELAARKEWPQARAEMLEELAKVRAERDALAIAEPRIREDCAEIARHLNGWGNDCGKGGHAEHIAAAILASIPKEHDDRD